MGKKLGLAAIMLSVIATVGFIGFGIWHSRATTPTFSMAGYVLQGDESGVKQLSFSSGESYASTLNGAVRFRSVDGEEAVVSRESFVHMEDDSVMALTDGVLLDFQDLSENFINNYYITAKLPITRSGDTYLTETTAGTMEFGDNLWKLSEDKYIIQSSKLTVHFSDEDNREVSDYVQISVSPDKVVYLLTPENLWMTISENCYVETAGGVRIYPVSLIVDDGASKLSLAKLTVSTDDAIVLTEDETRRQIVPELNLEAIDGEDGTAGEAGEDGEAGKDGEQGIEGEDGTDGEAGTAGEAGTDGTSGADGADGAQGAAGQAGSSGAQGTDGKKGSTPTTEGLDGQDGETGGTGSTGADAEVDSSTKTALPVMTLSKFAPTATSVSGTIRIDDEGEMLQAINGAGLASNYPGTVTITEVATGRIIHCYPSTSSVAGNYNFTDFYTGATSVDFYMREGDQLLPNMEYQLSVKAFYKASDATGLIYSREFINRIFYTDSTGVVLESASATTESVTVDVSVGEEYRELLANGSVTVYLLTPEQNRNFAPSAGSSANYLRIRTLNGGDFTSSNDYTLPVTFGNNVADDTETKLTPNTRYIVRAYVDAGGSFQTLTKQELSVLTLKRPPEVDGEPTTIYNRATGRVEVYRPRITDQDGGALRYIYTPQYLKDGDWVDGPAKTVTAATGDPVEFFQDPNVPYRYQITMVFDDNEKEVTYDLGTSGEVTTTGDALPGITLEPKKVEYNSYEGTLRIGLGSKSHLQIDANHPLRLTLYADQIVTSVMELTAPNAPVNVLERTDTMGTVTLLSQTSTEVAVNLDLQNLYRNTTYSIRVEGYINLGADESADPASGAHLLQSLGSVNFMTKALVTTSASFTPGDNTSGNAFSRLLKVNIDAADADRESYTRGELEKGQLMLVLYNGTGSGKIEIGRKPINEENDLKAVYGSGLEITDTLFGPPLSAGGSYTLQLQTIADGTYALDLGYVNDDFAVGSWATDVITATPLPPELLPTPTNGIRVIAIENSKAGNYGGVKDDSLPDDAIVGYALQATYENDQRIGKTVTYYAFEFASYVTQLQSGTNPLAAGGQYLMKMTQTIQSDSNSVPGVVVFFGGEKTNSDGDAASFNNWKVYYAGPANNSDGLALAGGMGRGYRYIFAYTATYQASEAEPVRDYPNPDSQDYKDQMQAGNGGLRLNGTTVGRDVGYFLTSGLCEAPNIMPDFHTYVYDSDAQIGSGPSLGSVTLHYTYRDPERMIDSANPQQFYLEKRDAGGALGTPVPLGAVNAGSIISTGDEKTVWHELTVPYSDAYMSDMPLLEVSVGLKDYNMDYTGALNAFRYAADSERLALNQIPVEWPWAEEFEKPIYNINLTVESVLTSNYYVFRVNATKDGQAATDLYRHAVALRMTFRSGSTTYECTEPLLRNSTYNVHARILFSVFQQQFGNSPFSLEKAELLYDTGEQGWGHANSTGGMAKDLLVYQYVNEATTDGSIGEFGFDSYLSGRNLEDCPASGALLESRSFSLSALRAVIQPVETSADRTYYTTYNTMTTRGGTALRLYPDSRGTSTGSGDYASSAHTRYVVPKVVGVFPKEIQLNNSENMSVSAMTPTVSQFISWATNDSISIGSLKIDGLGTGGGTIYAAAYLSESEAQNVGTNAQGRLIIQIGADGEVVSWRQGDGGPEQTSKTPVFNGLASRTAYWIVFYDGSGDQVRVFLDGIDSSSDNVKQAIYSRYTSENPVITIQSITATNTDYWTKLLDFNFSVTSYASVGDLKFSIYDTAQNANAGGSTGLLYSHDDLTGDTDPMLQYTGPLSPTVNNFKLNLTPNSVRSKLKPGGRYYLRIEVFDNSGNQIADSTHVCSFDVIPRGEYAASIYTARATRDEIVFDVTISDPQFTLMNARYAVRFGWTDPAARTEKRIATKYDDYLYDTASVGALRRQFVLNSSALKNTGAAGQPTAIQPDTTYHMYVYAVPDTDHTGQVTFPFKGGNETWTSSQFFEGVGTTEETVYGSAKGFRGTLQSGLFSVLETFWDTNLIHVNNTAEGIFRLMEKTQKTAVAGSGSDWILNDNPSAMYAFRKTDGSGQVRAVFEESFGLTGTDLDDPNDDVFSRIEWGVQIHSGTSFTSQSGPTGAGDNGPRFQKGVINGKDVFYLDIPCDASQPGDCMVTLRMYERGGLKQYTVTLRCS